MLAIALVAGLWMAESAPKAAFAASTDTKEACYNQTYARELIDLVNGFRTGSETWCWDENNEEKVYRKNLEELTWDYNLEQLAMQRVFEIVFQYSHTRPNGTKWYTAIPDFGIVSKDSGENIVYGMNSISTPDEAFNMWKEDAQKYEGQGHRRNMLNSGYNAIGVACLKVGNSTYWVMELGQTIDKGLEFATFDKPAAATLTSTGDVQIDYSEHFQYVEKEQKADPAKTTLKSLSNTKTRKLTVKWNKVSDVTGYQVQISTSKSFKKSYTTTKKVKGASKASASFTKLSKKTYYVRIRTYVTDESGTTYSDWSAVKKLKIKK